jgi:hypothetical protein
MRTWLRKRLSSSLQAPALDGLRHDRTVDSSVMSRCAPSDTWGHTEDGDDDDDHDDDGDRSCII